MTERALATIEQVLAIEPIEGADRVEKLTIRGWNVVSQKGTFNVGDLCFYFEVDSMMPTDDPRFAFLGDGHKPRTNADGYTGYVLKTKKLRGVYSQGLALPTSEFPELVGFLAINNPDDIIGTNVTDTLKIVKWETPLPAELGGKARGRIPGWVWHTDAERMQNVPEIFPLDDSWMAIEPDYPAVYVFASNRLWKGSNSMTGLPAHNKYKILRIGWK